MPSIHSVVIVSFAVMAILFCMAIFFIPSPYLYWAAAGTILCCAVSFITFAHKIFIKGESPYV